MMFSSSRRRMLYLCKNFVMFCVVLYCVGEYVIYGYFLYQKNAGLTCSSVVHCVVLLAQAVSRTIGLLHCISYLMLSFVSKRSQANVKDTLVVYRLCILLD